MYTTITSATLLSEIQRDLIETVDGGTTWASGHWTVSEVHDILYRRYMQFLKDTRLVTQEATIAVVPHTPRQSLPSQWVMSLRVAWKGVDDTVWKELPQSDTVETDLLNPTFGYQPETAPKFYTDGELPPPVVELYPPPDGPGDLKVHYIGLTSAFTPGSDSFTLPDDFLHYVKYGVMADMLAKVGRGQDLGRAAYCEQRYQEGVELAAILLAGGL